MKKTVVFTGHGNAHGYEVKRWTLLVPRVVSEFLKDGTRWYKTEDGKTYNADIYDLKLVPPGQRPKFI